MIKGLYLSARSLDQRMQNMQIVANNLANTNTTGFKKELEFSEVMANVKDSMGNIESKIRQVTDYSQGNIAKTSNPLDVAISGNGFFVVKTENGNEFTRNGRFKISEEGFLVDQQGNKVLGKSGEINLGNVLDENYNSITINNNGDVKIGDKYVDTILVAKIDDPQGSLKTKGLNFIAKAGDYQAADASEYQLKQGYLEESNINPIVEMENMINLSKDYESSKKILTSFDQTLAQANEIGKV
jgi:flagellar basal-body rod protein FlgF